MYNRFGIASACLRLGSPSADQRVYASVYGRFNTPDPLTGSASATNPASWNRYAYVNGDPINGFDPSGLMGRPTGASPSFYVGGHFNLDLSTAGLIQALGSGYSAFAAAFGGFVDGTRQAAVYGNAAQGNYTLHSKQYGNQTSGYYGVHFDRFNPLSNIPIGTIQHLFGDVIAGHVGTPCLDPAWQ